MDFTDVQAQLNDLPLTFKRPESPYTWLVDALSTELALFTEGVDDTVQQGVFVNALDGWLDVWGLIFDIARQPDEANAAYMARISETVLAWVGTLPALQAWIALFAPGGSVIENVGLGYSITLPSTLTTSQIFYFLQTLNRIRPAGVPFTVNAIAGGLFLGTINFLGEGMVAGSYLTASTTAFVIPIGPTTNNAAPQLPDLYFIDPTLNP